MTSLEAANQLPNFLKYLENVNSASPHTLRAYKNDLHQIFFKENITISDLRSYLQLKIKIWQTLSPSSRNRKIGSLKSFLNFLYDHHLIETPLAEVFYSPKVPKKIPHFISFDEVLSCLELFKHSDQTSWDQQFLFLLLYGGGLRISEACQLRPIDLLETSGCIRILGKGGKERLVSVPQMVWNHWNKRPNQIKEPSHYIFLSTNNKPLDTRVGYQWIVNIGSKAGLTKRLNPHALRHSFATHLLSSGANLRVIQQLLGHSTLAATEKYTHLNLSELYRTMENSHPLGKKITY